MGLLAQLQPAGKVMLAFSCIFLIFKIDNVLIMKLIIENTTFHLL